MFFRPIFFIALAACSSVAWAGDKPVYAPVPDWVKPAPPVAGSAVGTEAPILLVLDQQQRMQDGQLWAYLDTATRIASAEVLAQAGTVQLQWQPDKGDLIVHRAVIQRGAEQIDLLGNPARFTVLRRETQLERLEMNGLLTATMAAEGLRVGDVLRIAYSVTTTDPALMGGAQSLVLLPSAPLRIGFGRERLLWKRGTELRYRSYMPGADAAPTDIGGYRQIEIALPLPKPAELPGDVPVRLRDLPLLDASTFADWQAVSTAFASLYRTEGLIPPGSPLAGEVARIAKADSDPRKRAAAALELVQGQVRYLFQGMNGGNYTPQAPAQTWAVRYGDCKAKTLLLLALLRGLGIEAEAVLAHSQLGDALPRRLPMPAAFDHVLVRATIDGKSLWLDGTGQAARLADLDDTPPFVWVLPLREAGTGLIAVPRRPAGRVDIAVDLDVDQSAGLGMPALYRVAVTMRGPMASQLATAAGQLPAKEKREMMYSVLNPIIGDTQVIEHAVTQDAVVGTTTIKASGIMTAGWSSEEKRSARLLDRAITDLDFNPDRTRPAWRDLPVVTAPGGGTQFTTTIKLPAESNGFTLEGDTELLETLAGARVQRSTTLNKGVVRMTERVDAPGTEIAPAEISAVRARLALAKTRLVRVMAPENYPARWQIVQQSRTAGRFKPIEAAYAKAIANDPKEALGYDNRANFRSGTYDWRGAIADLDRVVAIEPTIDTYLRRSLLFKTIGDYPKALTDAETAYALDPGSVAAVGRLAGARADTGRIDDALSLLDQRIAAGGEDKGDYLLFKSDVLVQAGRGTEAVATMDQAVKDKPSNALLLNGRCWAKARAKLALDTALKDCTRSIELGESPDQAFDSRALVYFQMGRMDDALTDVDAALDISPGQAASLYLRGVIGRRRGNSLASNQDLAAARLMRPTIDQQYARWGVKP